MCWRLRLCFNVGTFRYGDICDSSKKSVTFAAEISAARVEQHECTTSRGKYTDDVNSKYLLGQEMTIEYRNVLGHSRPAGDLCTLQTTCAFAVQSRVLQFR